MNCISKRLRFFLLLFSFASSSKLIKARQICSDCAFLHNSRKRISCIQDSMVPYSNMKRGTSSTGTLSKLYMSSLDKNDKLVDPTLIKSENLIVNDSKANNDFDGEITDSNDLNDGSVVTNDRKPGGKSEKEEFGKDLLSFFETKVSPKASSSIKIPPFIVEDTSVLFYDVFLLINLSLSISFWVVHRMEFDHIGNALSEGSLLSILWIISGLYRGAFLMSAVDGHYGSDSEKGGPKAAGMLGLSTFLTTANIRIVIALVMAHIEHRPVGSVDGEMLMPLEIVSGILLMSLWRALHSYHTPRI